VQRLNFKIKQIVNKEKHKNHQKYLDPIMAKGKTKDSEHKTHMLDRQTSKLEAKLISLV
jgi:hypothetical protein